jgi:hypothetical protein
MAQSETQYAGWLSRLLTHPVKGVENFEQLYETSHFDKGVIKTYCEVAEARLE